MLQNTRTGGQMVVRSIGPTAILLAALLFAGCGDTTTEPLSSEVTGESFAASLNSGAVVNTEPINLGDQTDIQGTAAIKCLRKGTQVNVHMTGLQPNALYTIWILEFDGSSLIGLGALGNQTPAGPNDGYRNVFTASASGVGQITRLHPAGVEESVNFLPFPKFTAPSCLTDLNKFIVRGLFHDDGMAWGAVPWENFPGDPVTGSDEFDFEFTI